MPQTKPWWRNAVTYEIYIRSFADSDGNGVGDLEGIRQKLPYVKDLGVDAIWITPFYPSPMADHGYDVADYDAVDPIFGQLADFHDLVADAHAHGLKVIIDLVANHTSNKHRWFKAALRDPSSPERDYYVFRDAAPDGGPPNDWQSHFGGAAWTWEPESAQYYLHCFAPEQPDLNWDNDSLAVSFDLILRFWLERGVDGFRLDVANGIRKDLDATKPPEHPGKTTTTIPGWNQPEAREVFERWHKIIAEYPGDRVLVGEVGTVDTQELVQYLGGDALQLTFNFPFLELPFDAAAYRDTITEQLTAHQVVGEPCTWVLGNHDQVRVATRYGGGELGRRRAAAAFMLIMALPGAPFIFQGEELGLEEVDVPEARREDPVWFRSKGAHVGRDGCRTPMPWTGDAPGFGFNETGHSWLPFSPDAEIRNVGTETATRALFPDTLALRREHLAAAPETITWLVTPNDTLAFRHGDVVCALNSGNEPATLDVPDAGSLLIASSADSALDGSALTLPPASAAWVQIRR